MLPKLNKKDQPLMLGLGVGIQMSAPTMFAKRTCRNLVWWSRTLFAGTKLMLVLLKVAEASDEGFQGAYAGI